jgi:DNA-binding MarR family transcriptional regulator
MEEVHNSIAISISILQRFGQIFIGKRVESYNIGSGQYVFLIALFKRDGISQEALSKYIKIDKATTARAIKLLEAEGFVKREIDIDDKRAYKVFLTQKAYNLKIDMEEVVGKWLELITSNLTEEEKETAQKLLLKMAANAHACTPET